MPRGWKGHQGRALHYSDGANNFVNLYNNFYFMGEYQSHCVPVPGSVDKVSIFNVVGCVCNAESSVVVPDNVVTMVSSSAVVVNEMFSAKSLVASVAEETVVIARVLLSNSVSIVVCCSVRTDVTVVTDKVVTSVWVTSMGTSLVPRCVSPHRWPDVPGGQSQVKLFTPSRQRPPL